MPGCLGPSEADLDRALSIECRLDAVRRPVEESTRKLAGVVGKLVRLEPDGKVVELPKRRAQTSKSRGEPPEHPLRPRRPEARDSQNGATTVDRRRLPQFPPAADRREHLHPGV